MLKEDFEEGPRPDYSRVDRINYLLKETFGPNVRGDLRTTDMSVINNLDSLLSPFSERLNLVAEVTFPLHDEHEYFIGDPIGRFSPDGDSLTLLRRGFLGRFAISALMFQRLYKKEYGNPLKVRYF
ncbi:hypothetical protein HYT24_03255 [Candidatus Pacearchaeota archaeon]|nr:hypothetical protein [Candidatus Pacearchaeota archaeon]